MGDWDHPYITLLPEFESAEIRVFGKMYENGYIYQGKKPVYWSWSSESTFGGSRSRIPRRGITINLHFLPGQGRQGQAE